MRRISQVILVAALGDASADHWVAGEDVARGFAAARHLDVTNDTVAMAGAGVSWGCDIARVATDADFGAVPLDCVGQEVCSAIPQGQIQRPGFESVLDVAHKATRVGQGFARKVAQASLSATQSGLRAVGSRASGLLKLAAVTAVGQESADALVTVQRMVCEFAAPIVDADAPPLPELLQAARAWGALQHAAAAQTTTPDSLDLVGEALLPEEVERLVRFTAAAYGAERSAGHVDGLSTVAERFAGVARSRAAIARGGGPAEAAMAFAGLEGQIEVLAFEQKPNELFAPGFLVAVDHDIAKVVVALRGTSSVADALTDLVCEPSPVQFAGHGGMAHGGMLRAARSLQGALAELVDQGFARLGANRQRRVVISGHSLGAGVAALIAALWRDAGRFPGSVVECLAFACPQVLDHDLAMAQSNHTTSFIVGNDLVPRFSLATAKDLRTAMLLLGNGSSEVGLRTAEVLAAEARGDARALAIGYEALRPEVCKSAGRLYPSGRLIHLQPGQQARLVGYEIVDELFIAGDMVSAHTLRSYLLALQEAGRSSSGS